MATKAQLEKKISDLQTVLAAVQDEREELRAVAEMLRGENTRLGRMLEIAADDKNADEDKIAELTSTISDIREDTREELEQALVDRERLLGMLNLTEHDWSLKRDSLGVFCALPR